MWRRLTKTFAAPARLLSGLLPHKPPSFWDRYNQARLMIERLNDEDIGSLEATRSLKLSQTNEFDAICELYYAFAAITIKADQLAYRGYEFDFRWQSRLESLMRHLDEHIYSRLRGDSAQEFNNYVVQSCRELGQQAEILHPCGPQC